MRLVHVFVGATLVSLAAAGCAARLGPDAQRVYDFLVDANTNGYLLAAPGDTCAGVKRLGVSAATDNYGGLMELDEIPRADVLAGVEQFMKYCDGK